MLLGTWSRKMHHSAMPRQASIRRSRPSSLGSGSSPTNALGMATRSCIWRIPGQENGPTAGVPGVSLFTVSGFIFALLLETKRQTLSFADFARPQLSHAITAARPSCALDEVSPRGASAPFPVQDADLSAHSKE